MHIRTKLAAGLISILVVNLAASLFGFHLLSQAAARKSQVQEASSAIVTTALRAQVHFKKQVQEWKNILLRGGEPGLFEEYLRRFEHEEQRTRETMDELIRRLTETAQAPLISRRFLEAHRRLGEEYRTALARYRAAEADSRLAVDGLVRSRDREPTDLLDQVVAAALDHESRTLAGLEDARAVRERQVLVLMIGTMSGAVLFLVWLVDRTIGQPIAMATVVARRVSQGDLSTPVEASGNDEPALMLAALRAMQESLRRDVAARQEAEAALRAAHNALADERAQLAERVRLRTLELDRANAELARAAQAKDEFLAAMSHELRTPLTSILGAAETMGDGLLGPLSKQQGRALRMIQENGTHLLDLINDILDMSRVASGQMHLRWDQVPVDQLCEASLRLIAPAARRKALRVASRLDPQARLVHGDSRRLKQMLVNLLGNAVKFTPEGGSIGLDVEGDPQTCELRIGIWDTGIGIPADQLGRLFERFVQLDSRPSRQYEGTGLGLALAHGMAGLHQGRIEVQSEVGRGSRFTVVLPWDPDAQTVRQLAAECEADAGGPGEVVHRPRVLIVEDNAYNLDLFATYLRIKGCEVLAAADGEQAIALTRGAVPDAILMDVQMARMDGLETTRRLRADPALRRTPIIALTALAMPGDRERCLEAGMDDYLSKPLGLKELHNTVIHWIMRQAAA